MGNNNQKENAQFGKNFNMQEHNRKMAGMRHNYAEHNLDYQRNNGRVNAPKQQSYTKIERKNAIFKPSIAINLTSNQLILSFQYNSEFGCELFVYVGVNNINQDDTKKNTMQIQSDNTFYQKLSSGQKLSFKKSYAVGGKDLLQKQIVIRIQEGAEATEYSLRRVNQAQQHWKIILQKLQKDDKTYELQNIYGSGDGGQQCIVCMCDQSNTLVKPCNHLCLCKQCAKAVSVKTNKCPICRKNITDLVTIASS